MNTPKCVKCNLPTKKVTVNKIFMDKYVVSDTTVYVCGNCGEEYLDDKEYSRISAKVQEVDNKLRIPELQEVLAKVRFLVL
jgi:YgiT-type zinc finger domain-containing protein